MLNYFFKAIFDKLISEFEISTEDFMQKFNKWELLDNKMFLLLNMEFLDFRKGLFERFAYFSPSI